MQLDSINVYVVRCSSSGSSISSSSSSRYKHKCAVGDSSVARPYRREEEDRGNQSGRHNARKQLPPGWNVWQEPGSCNTPRAFSAFKYCCWFIFAANQRCRCITYIARAQDTESALLLLIHIQCSLNNIVVHQPWQNCTDEGSACSSHSWVVTRHCRG